jgi:glycosyltransferase involved in cell wall biosynthesis
VTKPGFLFVLSTLGVGGSEAKIVRIANALSLTGSRVEIAYLNPPETLRCKIDKTIRVTHLRRRGKYSFRAVRRLAGLIEERKCLVVAVNLYPLLYAIPAAKVFSSRSTPVVGLINTAMETRKLRWLGRIYAPFLRRCDRIVFGCKSELEQWAIRFKLPLDKSECIYNGVDHEFLSPDWIPDAGAANRKRVGIPEQAFVIGSVGRLAPEKNYDLLIAALARLNADSRDCYLVLAGHGKEKAKLERLALKLNISSKVRFLGLLDDVRPAISMMDVFVLPSREVETFSNAALEAMAMARPIVLSEIGGAAEMVENQESGLLFKIGDLETLCGELIKLRDSRPMRDRLGQAARERVLQSFTFAQMVERYRRLAAV